MYTEIELWGPDSDMEHWGPDLNHSSWYEGG